MKREGRRVSIATQVVVDVVAALPLNAVKVARAVRTAGYRCRGRWARRNSVQVRKIVAGLVRVSRGRWSPRMVEPWKRNAEMNAEGHIGQKPRIGRGGIVESPGLYRRVRENGTVRPPERTVSGRDGNWASLHERVVRKW